MIIKVKNKPGFAQIQNSTLRDKRLSLEARGALGEILTYSEDFEASVENLKKLWGIGREKLLKITNSLKEFGYLEIAPVRDKRGRVIDWEWNFYGESQGIDFRKTACEKENETADQSAAFQHSGDDQDTAFTNVGENQHLEKPYPLLKIRTLQEEEEKDLKTHTQKKSVCGIIPEKISQEKINPPDPPIPKTDSNAVGHEKFTADIWKVLEAKRLDTPFENPKWQSAMDYAFRRKFSVEDFAATIEHLLTDPEETKWRRGRLTAETVTNNLQKVWDIRAAAKKAAAPAGGVDFSKCPDCDVRGMKEVEIQGEKVMVKCRHERLKQTTEANI